MRVGPKKGVWAAGHFYLVGHIAKYRISTNDQTHTNSEIGGGKMKHDVNKDDRSLQSRR